MKLEILKAAHHQENPSEIYEVGKIYEFEEERAKAALSKYPDVVKLPETNLEKMTKPVLIEKAKALNLSLAKRLTKKEIIHAIKAVED